MKVSYKLLVPAFLAGLMLVACGQQDAAAPVEEVMEQATESAGEMAEKATESAGEMAEKVMDAASDEPGGYVPTDDERVPGETR